MDRNDSYSYWLSISHPDLTPLFQPGEIKAITDDLTARFDGNLVYTDDGAPCDTIQMQVDDNKGAISMLTDAFDIITQWAKEHPDLIISLEELNEDDNAEQHFMSVIGENVLKDAYARIVDAETGFDWLTVDSVADFVTQMFPGDQGAELATRIRDFYRPNCSNT